MILRGQFVFVLIVTSCLGLVRSVSVADVSGLSARKGRCEWQEIEDVKIVFHPKNDPFQGSRSTQLDVLQIQNAWAPIISSARALSVGNAMTMEESPRDLAARWHHRRSAVCVSGHSLLILVAFVNNTLCPWLFLDQMACGMTTEFNNTYFHNPGFPDSYRGGSRWWITLVPLSIKLLLLYWNITRHRILTVVARSKWPHFFAPVSNWRRC